MSGIRVNETAMHRLLPSIASTFGNPINFIELGAHEGVDTYWLLQFLLSTRKPFNFVALEPDPRIVRPTLQHVKSVNAAIAAYDGKTTLYLSGGTGDDGVPYSGSSSTHPPGLCSTYWPKMTFNETVDVPAIALDTLCSQFGMNHVDFIWCDTQGCEIDVIQGGSRMLPRTKWFFTEYADGEIYKGQATFDQLKQMIPFMTVHTDMKGDALFSNQIAIYAQA